MRDITLHILILLCMLFLSFSHALGEEIHFSTLNTRSYTIVSNHGVSADDRLIIFKLRACGHAYVGLMTGPTEDDPLHEFVFGGDYNSASFLRAGKSYSFPDLDRTTGTILDCFQYKELWITWDDYTFSVGLGVQVTGSPFLTWTSSKPLLTIKNIGIATAHGDTGEWTFYSKDDIQTTTSRITDVSTKLLTTSASSTKISSSSTSQLAVDDTTTGLQTTESIETTVGSTRISSFSTIQLAVDDITTSLQTTEFKETTISSSSISQLAIEDTTTSPQLTESKETTVDSTKISSFSTNKHAENDITTKSIESTVGSTKMSPSISQNAVDDITTGLPTTETQATPTCPASCIKTYTCKCPDPSNRPPTSIPTIPLKLDKKTLSSYRNQHTSASDSRKSSFYIGCVGITVLVLTVAFIAILDCVPSS